MLKKVFTISETHIQGQPVKRHHTQVGEHLDTDICTEAGKQLLDSEDIKLTGGWLSEGQRKSEQM